jgi:hypothetical protein
MSDEVKEVVVWDGKYKRRLLEIECKGCGKKILIRKSRKHSGLCRSCGKSGERNEMHGKRPHNYINGNRAKECTLEYLSRIRKERKKKIILMMGNKCHDCGTENLPINCYHMHHVDPETKCFSVMSKLNENRFFREESEIMTQEIEKCILLCLNCHKIHHCDDERAND